MSLRRDVQKLTDSTKWAQIQEKFQNNFESEKCVNPPQNGSLLSSKESFDGSLLKCNGNSASEHSENYTKEEAATSDTNSSSQSKEIDFDVTTKTGKKYFSELCAENEEQLINTTAECDSEIADKQSFTTEIFSEMAKIDMRLPLPLQNQTLSTKMEGEAAILENVSDQKSRTSYTVLHSEVVENKSANNCETERDALLQNNQNAESLRPEPQDQSCHDETFHTLSEGEIKKCFSSEVHQRNIVFPRKSIVDFPHTNVSRERRKMLRNSCPRKISFHDRRKHHFERPLKSKGTVKSLINKFEEMSAEKLQDTQNDNSQSASAEKHNISSDDIHQSNDHSSNCNEETCPIRLTRNQDDSGISEGEETQSPKHIYQSINYRLIENYNRYLSEINAESSTLHDSMIRCFPDCVPKHIYINYPGRIYKEIKQSRLMSKLPRPNLIVKKPVPLPRSYSSPHYFHISECYSGHPYQQRESRKQKCENLGSKLTQSEEEWADISEEEKEVLSYSQKLANVSKKLYDFKFPHNCSETSHVYDCCSPPRQRWNYNAKCRKEDNSTGDSSWETLSLPQGEEEDDDKSSTTSSEHHYEAINDFLRFEPGNLSSYRSDQQNADEFIRDSFNFLNTLSAEESDDTESPSALSTDSRSLKDSYGYKKKKLDGRQKLSFDSRDSITETILMYQELSSFRRSFNKKTFKNILKENALESNKLKKQPLFSKSSKEKLNFHVPWFSKTDNNQKQQSYESILEQLSIDSPDCKEKKKGKYFTMPHPKKIGRSEQHFENLTDIDNSGNFDSSRRTSDSSLLSTNSKNRELPEGTEASYHESSGNDNSLELQSSNSSSVSVGNRDSVISCTSCADGYICRKHLESTSNSSSSEESVNYIREKMPIDVNFVKVRQRVESTGSEHSYFQIGDFSQSLNDEEQMSGSNRNNSNEHQNNSELYCDLSSLDSPSEAHMSVEQLSAQSGGKKLWSDIPEVQKSGVLEKMTAQELKLQDAIFNVAMFEATYLRLLETYQEHFVRSSSNSDGYSLCTIISWHEWHLVFSDSLPIIEVSRRLMADIERRWDESYTTFDIADILYENVKTHFHAYVKYCSNKPYRDRMLKVLMNTKPKFAEVTRFLEASAECQGFLLEEFLMLPAHHISDLLHLIEEIVHWLPSSSSRCSMYNEIMDLLCKLKLECEKGALQMERMEEMLLLAQQIVFKDCKPLSLISVSRWLLKRGEMTHLVCFIPNKRTFVKNVRWNKVPVYVFLFNDYLIVTKRRSDESYSVLDYCPKNIVQVEFLDDQNTRSNLRPPSNYKNLLQLTLWSNHENKTVEMILSCPSESDKIRWGEALSSETTDSDSAERQDSYNVQCIRPYTASQADELTLFESDVVKVLRKVADGWYKGKHIKDGNMGWFPVSCATEDVHDFRMNHFSHGHKYSPVSPTGGSKIPVSPK